MKNFNNIKTNPLPDSEIEITGELAVEYINSCRGKALKELNNKANLPGFRSGHIPENILVKNLGEMKILEEAAEIALGEEYHSILKEADITPIGQPLVAITKLAPGIPLEFKITTATEPIFDLPDYKKIAKEISKEEALNVEEHEIEAVIQEIRREKAHSDLHQKLGIHDHSHDPIKDEDLPEVNDDFARSVGEFEDLMTFKEKIKENLGKEKEFRAKEKKRLEIIQNLLKETKIPVPKILVESELSKMLAQFRDDVTRAGMKFEAYLGSIKKTEEDIKNDWRSKAEDRVKSELLIAKIGEAEKIEPEESELEKEAKHLLEHYPDADPLRARIYIYTMMRNEKVFQFLENLK
jgi:FKBP-type peptidyl-prolyl cis-trans isomerase (trigger factor)